MTRSPSPGGRRQEAAACDFLAAALSQAGPRCREIADMIFCVASPSQGGPAGALLSDVLHRNPGCAAAAAAVSPRECVVADRRGTVIRLAVHGGPATQPTLALTCGSLAYAWLCARPLAALDRATVRLASYAGQQALHCEAHGASWSCSLSAAACGEPGQYLAYLSLMTPASAGPRRW